MGVKPRKGFAKDRRASRGYLQRMTTLVIVGATGDLAGRMLLPALYFLEQDGLLAPEMTIIGVSRQALDQDGFLAHTRTAIGARSEAGINEQVWARFCARLNYLSADLTSPEGAKAAKALIGANEAVFYLATSPSLYAAIGGALRTAGLTSAPNRVVLEKPIGRDAETSEAINAAVGLAFSEDRVFRIDHYLGKETVQNLIALRFANVLFEPLWNSVSIDHVQITVAETEGVGERWPYYDEYGALRDMLQNHMLQLLCLVAMEPPATLDPDSLRNEKVKTLRSLRPLSRADVQKLTVRGQYRAYVQERGAATDTETFVAMCAYIDNWRWAGTPFFLRTGKRMSEKRTQIVIQFKAVPHSIFAGKGGQDLQANRLVIDLQPDEAIRLLLMNKTPGLDEAGMRLSPVHLSLTEALGGGRRRIAYERLLLDVIKRDRTLFVRRDEVEASWAWIDGIAEAWEGVGQAVRPYEAGSWGPSDAVSLIERTGRSWHDDACD